MDEAPTSSPSSALTGHEAALMPLPDNAPDLWAKMTDRGLYHFVPAGEIMASCGVMARNAVSGHHAADVSTWPDDDRPRRCHACLKVARKVGHK